MCKCIPLVYQRPLVIMLPMTAFVSTIMFGYSLLHYKFYQHRRALCTTIVCLVRPLVFFFLVLQQLFISLTSIIFFQFYPLMLYSHIFKLRKLIHLVCYVVFGKLINVQALNCCWNLREEKGFFYYQFKKIKKQGPGLTKKQNNSFYYSWGVENHVLVPQTFMFFIYNPWFLEFYVLVLNFICFRFYSLEFKSRGTC